jgi:hypothetical protein
VVVECGCPAALRQVALRRWFSWTYAYERFDDQWTAARVVTRWLLQCLGTWVEQEAGRWLPALSKRKQCR